MAHLVLNIILVCCRLSLLFVTTEATTIPDTKLSTTTIIALSGDHGPAWTLRSGDGRYSDLHARVPGDILSDLMLNHLIDDPYFDTNFLTQRNVWMGKQRIWNTTAPLQLEKRTRIWIYETILDIDIDPIKTYRLVLDGVKMGASISINNVHIGNVTNQFLRYEFKLNHTTIFRNSDTYTRITKKTDSPSRNIRVSVTFDPAIQTNGRFSACSGGWDWAPYSKAADERGSRVLTFGIIQPIYLVEVVGSISITYVVPKITYLGDECGDYPTRPMINGPHYDFRVTVDIHIKCHNNDFGNDASNVILLRSDFSEEIQTLPIHCTYAGAQTIVTGTLTASSDDIRLWWPNGHGEQPLYHIFVSHIDQRTHRNTEWINTTIAFRSCHLVTIDDTNETLVNQTISSQVEGSGAHGMYFRVNGALLWARGANVVPMDQLEGRLTDEAHVLMVQSAAKANMNMLRVWGGGMIFPKAFYEACDELGVLLYHDMMFVEEQYHNAMESEVIEKEIRHTVRNLASHPSIVLWSGCNECSVVMGTPTEVYATFVMRIVAEEDNTRIVWPSCPSDTGWKTGVSRISGKPNGKNLTTYPQHETERKLELHGPYQHGFSIAYPSVNGHDTGRNYSVDTPPTFNVSHEIGPSYPNHFISEFGISSFSSFESMSSTLSPENWGIHGADSSDTCSVYDQNVNICLGENVLAERNYACDSHIDAFFGSIDDNEISEHYFKGQLYHCAIANALWLKSQIEILRSTNSFGALIWQLNENWPTGGWGLLEYGAKRGQGGQSIGGRWKPIMHLLRQSLFRDVFVACGRDGKCYCKNDGLMDFRGKVVIETWSSLTGAIIDNQSLDVSLEGGTSRTGESFLTTVETLCRRFSNLNVGLTEWFDLNNNVTDLSDVVLLSLFNSNGSSIIENNVFLWSVPRDIRASYLTAKINIVEISMVENKVHVILESDQLALYVVVTTKESGTFDQNAFVMKSNVQVMLTFLPSIHNLFDKVAFAEHLRVEHLGSYL